MPRPNSRTARLTSRARPPLTLALTMVLASAFACGGCRGEPPSEPGARASPRPSPVAVKDARAPEAELPADAAALPAGTRVAVLASADLRGEYEAHPNGGLARRSRFTGMLRSRILRVVQVDAGDEI
jgi:hypothetical protein